MSLPLVKGPNDFPFKYTGQPDQFGQSQGGDFATIQALFDSRAEYNQTQINAIITALKSVTLGDDGAKNIGLKLNELIATDVNGAIKELYDSIVGIVLGQIPNGSVTDAKLATGGIKDTAMPKSGGTYTGFVEHSDNEVRQPKIKDYSETVATQSTSGALVIDLNDGNNHEITVTGTITSITFSNWKPSGTIHAVSIKFIQTGTAYAITIPSNFDWIGGNTPSNLSQVNKHCWINLITTDGGTSIDAIAGVGFAN